MRVRDFNELALIFERARERLPAAMKETAKDIGEGIARRAKSKLGTYREGWAPLAEETKQRRAARGFPADEPLLVEGNLRESIHDTVQAKAHRVDTFVGSDLTYARRQELGMAQTPPRPYLKPAAVESIEDVQKKVQVMLGNLFDG